jgi:4-hydroxy-tetrahydrodipicolinate reductase
MPDIIICGVSGRLGRATAERAATIDDIRVVAGVDKNPLSNAAFPVYDAFGALIDAGVTADVCVDCSVPDALSDLLAFSLLRGIPLVLAATGYAPGDEERIQKASQSLPIFASPNMSYGVCVLRKLVAEATRLLHDSYDIEIVEKHHNRKVDAPSGTAAALIKEIDEASGITHMQIYDRTEPGKRKHGQIGVSSVRGGTVTGVHEIGFYGDDEHITITHAAQSRDVFALGTLRAAKFIISKPPGLYGMNDLINL